MIFLVINLKRTVIWVSLDVVAYYVKLNSSYITFKNANKYRLMQLLLKQTVVMKQLINKLIGID